VNHRITVDGIQLAAHLARPGTHEAHHPAVVIGHGFPSGVGEAATAAATLPELVDRIAQEMGWLALALAFRGCSGSAGNFALDGWLADLLAAVEHLRADEHVRDVWVVGFGTGGALAMCAGVRDPSIRGVAAMAAPADFDDWASHPRRLLEHARQVGLIHEPGFPESMERWSRALRDIQAVSCAARYSPRPLLVVHGSEDDVVPVIDARVLADAHGSAEVRLIAGAGHRLRHDPRAMAVLLGWLDRQRHELRVG
jgi:putative redox protein